MPIDLLSPEAVADHQPLRITIHPAHKTPSSAPPVDLLSLEEPAQPAAKPAPAAEPVDLFQPVKDFTDYTKRNFEAGKEAVTAPYKKDATAGSDLLQRIGDAGGRALGAVEMATAPLGGVKHAAVSKPLERAANVPSDYTDLLLSFTPAGVGGLAGGAGRVAKAIPGGSKALSAAGKLLSANSVTKLAKETFSPTTIDKDAGKTEGIVREQRGLAERSTEQLKARVEPDAEYLTALPPAKQLEFINRVETFTKSKPLADPRMEKAASNLRSVYQTVKNDLQTDPNFDKMGFVNDYFPHMWQDPKKAQAFTQNWVSKYGSGKSTQLRKIPTIEDGIKAGLVPKSTNPVETTMQYIGNMYNYKALKGMQSAMKDQGLRKFFPKGHQPAGWVELKGPGNSNLVSTKKGAFEQVAYAPESAARVYNRYYSPGFTGTAGQVSRGLRSIVNGGTQLVLGLSGYHYRLLANESTASAYSKGLSRVEAGKPNEALKAVGHGTPYASAVRHYKLGKAAEEQYVTGKGNLDHKIIDYITRGGGRMKGIDKTMVNSAAGNYWKAIKNGGLKAAMKADALNIKAGGPIKSLAKIMDTVAYPLFVKTIPRIKNGVNYEALADWVKFHPNATDEEILKATRDIVDSTDNIFGEMIQDNLFWDKKLKESLQLMMLSTGWVIGTGREVVGGTKDLAKALAEGGELSPRARYIIAAPVANMLHASVYQYLKTGTLPSQPQDFVHPKTGGTSPYNDAWERSDVPGNVRDIIGYQKDLEGELAGKITPVLRTAYEMAMGQDWRKDPIYTPDIPNAPGWLRSYAQYVLDAYVPIGVKGAVEGPMKGSNIGRTERLIAGSRPAGMQKENPQAYDDMMKKKQLAAEKAKIRHDAIDVQRHQQ